MTGRVLGWLGSLSNLVLAGAAFTVLCLGIVTWLPALAAVAFALQRWRVDGDARCFTGVFAGWRQYWRALLPHSIASTIGLILAFSNLTFLSQQSGPAAVALFMTTIGLIAVAVVHHLALAVAAGRDPEGSVASWSRTAFRLAFCSVPRGTALLGAAIAAPVFSLVVPAGPLLLGTTIPVLVGLLVADQATT